MWLLCAFSMYGQVSYEASSHWLGQVGSINFIVHLYPCGLLCVCFWVTGANTRAFDPCYFQLQTIDFNYQTSSFSATAPSPASVPRSADEVRGINGNVAAGVCHFQSVLPIPAGWNLMAFIHPSFACWGMTTLHHRPGPLFTVTVMGTGEKVLI